MAKCRRRKTPPRNNLSRYLLLSLGIVAATAFFLHANGRAFICECGYVKLWHGVVFSSENSQHLADWYTFSHIIHGFLFYAALWLVGRRFPWFFVVGRRLVLAVALESGWEILENSDFIINRYRADTIALDYFGDSVLNSLSDIMAMTAGFLLASRLRPAATVALALSMEMFTVWSIRDNLVLNVIMLSFPQQSIREWQDSGR